jgi:hypothetical protein
MFARKVCAVVPAACRRAGDNTRTRTPRPLRTCLVTSRFNASNPSPSATNSRFSEYESFAKPITKTGLLRVILYYLNPITPPNNTQK